jgi:hypothetical protein
MTRVYATVYLVSVVLAASAAALGLASILVGACTGVVGWRYPLDSVGGIIVSEDAVFIGGKHTGRVYKFGLDGALLDWVDTHGQPVSITQNGDSIVVHYSGREWALTNSGFRVSDPHGTIATVERTWWGRPVLAVRRSDGTTIRAFLQPWYLTLIQMPYPAMAWPLVAVAFGLIARWSRVKGNQGPSWENRGHDSNQGSQDRPH